MKRVASVVWLACVSAACADGPVSAPEAPAGGAPAGTRDAALTTGAACTHRWGSAVSGSWSDPAMWDAGTVPGGTSVVCIDAFGPSYTVTASTPIVAARELIVSSSAATLDVQVPASGAGVLSLGDLTIGQWATVTTDVPTVVNGTISITGDLVSEASITAGTIDIEWGGGVEATRTSTWRITSRTPLVNDGVISIGPGATVTLDATSGGTISFDDGAVTGSGELSIVPRATTSLDFRWNGGVLATRLGDPFRAIVVLRRTTLTLGNDALVGTVDVQPDGGTARIIGDIGAGVSVRVVKALAGPEPAVQLVGPNPTSISNFTLVAGRLELTSLGDVLAVAGSVVNQGTVLVGPGRVDLAVTTFGNYGTLAVLDSLRFTAPGALLHNRGAITQGGRVVMAGGTFRSEPTGTMTGLLGLEAGARLVGTGGLARVNSVGGIIDPNELAYGTLTMTSLTLDAASRLVVDVDSDVTGASDRLTITSGAAVAGTLEVRTSGSSNLDMCGESRVFLTNGKQVPRTGSFTTLIGMGSSSHVRGWRLHSTPTALQLLGYLSHLTVSTSPLEVALTEGGGGASVDVCLSGTPTSDVVVTPTSLGGQVTFTPASLTFRTTNYHLPQRVTVRAVDDAVGEGPHADSVRYAVTSADPAYAAPVSRRQRVTLTDNDPGADLSASLVSWDSAVLVGENFDARFSVANAGPNASTGSTFTIAMAGFDYSHGGAGVTCSQGGTLLTCTVGPLAAGAQIEFSLVFTSRTAGAHANTVRIAGSDYDHVTTNDSFVWNVTIN